jgi:putative DNA primase/helicase
MPHLYDNMPPLLKRKPNWVVWGFPNAPPKSPFIPSSLLAGRPAPAKAGVRETWRTYQAAAECVARGLARGIGYEFDGGGIYGVDLDHVIDAGGTLTPEAREIVDLLNSYTEVSPSGSGLHLFRLPPANRSIYICKNSLNFIYSSSLSEDFLILDDNPHWVETRASQNNLYAFFRSAAIKKRSQTAPRAYNLLARLLRGRGCGWKKRG